MSDYGEDHNGKCSAGEWLDRIADAERYFKFYQEACDRADRVYANLERLANKTRDREFQMFWSSIQVLNPSIYARPPIPVVTARFQDRRPVRRVASELLERVTVTSFELTDIDHVMLSTRDSLTRTSRGIGWVRYEDKGSEIKGDTGPASGERVVIEYLNRRDFLHDPARQWCDVDWVARRGWLDRKAMRRRFGEEVATAATYTERRDDNRNTHLSDMNQQKAGVWELWSRSENRVVWLCEGYPEFLDDDKPHLKLDGFFPTPRPAYATLQPDTLIPVPEMYMCLDQLDEVNELTDRIAKLSDSVVVRGFYPAGAGEAGDAIEAAFKQVDNGRVMVPVSNFAAFGGNSAKDMIIWLPIEMIVATIEKLVALRKQLIDDVYQITGLSDIMRGSTAATETATAQQLKAQFGSIRVRDRQNELVRYARDLVRITAEIVAEEFTQKTLLEMSQMELPTTAAIEKQIREIEKQARQIEQQANAAMQMAQQDPQIMAQAQENPEQAQQMMQQAEQAVQQQLEQLQAQAAELAETVTIDQVMDLLREQRLRPFILDIESDSTIQPDEDAAKQRAVEATTAIGSFMQQAIMAVQAVPQSAPFMAETLKYLAGQFRMGREMQSAIDEFADNISQMGQQPDPAQAAAEQAAAAEQQRAEAENARTQADMQIKQQEAQSRAQEMMVKLQGEQQKLQLELSAKTQAEQIKLATAEAKLQEAQVKLEIEAAKAQQGLQSGQQKIAAEQIKQQTTVMDAEIKARQADQSAELAERAARTKATEK